MLALRVTIVGTVAGLVATSMVLGTPAAGGQALDDSAPAPVSNEVVEHLAADGEAMVLVEMETHAGSRPDVEEVSQELVAEGGHVLSTPQPLVAATVDQQQVEELRSSPGVRQVLPNRSYRLEAAQDLEMIGAPSAWSSATGSGQTIAVIDSGVDATHPSLAGKVLGEACFSSTGISDGVVIPLCPGGNPRFATGTGAGVPCVLSGLGGCIHGTHVAGIAAATAPGASLLSVQIFSKVLSSTLCGGVDKIPCMLTFDSDLIEALGWVAAQTAAHSVAAVNLSIGGATSPAPCTANPLVAPIDALHALGVATVAASGNNGNANEISWPACIPKALAVGSVGPSYGVSGFSNSAAMLDLLAPGEGVVSTVPGGGVQALSGTSMATPHVSGAVALLREAKGAISVDHLSTILRATGLELVDARNGRVTPMPQLGTAAPDIGPIGHLDLVAASQQGSALVTGWALDLDAVSPVTVQVQVNGETAWTGPASNPRPDVAAAYPGLGQAHGTTAVVDLPGGTSQVCLVAQDATFPERPPVQIGCQVAIVENGVIVSPATFFSDVQVGHPFYSEISWLKVQAITDGFPEGTFRPGATISRQAMAAFLYRLAGSPGGPGPACEAQPFDDVAIGSAFCGEIAWLKAMGITTGNADGTFAPGSGVSRQAMAAFLYRYAGSLEGVDPTCGASPFSDVAIGSAFCGEIAWLDATGITDGFPGGTFHPADVITRQAMAAFVYRYSTEVLPGL